MTLDVLAATPRPYVLTPEVADEHRIYRRLRLTLPGRFMRANRSEYACQVQDLSVGGLSILTEAEVAADAVIGERIVVYIDRLGGVEGHVVRTGPDHIAIAIQATQNKREKLAAQLTYIINEAELDDVEARREERFPLRSRAAVLTFADGATMTCLILDVSLSGASIALDSMPEIGSEVWLGRLRGRIVRHHEEGVGIQFMESLDLSTLMAYFG